MKLSKKQFKLIKDGMGVAASIVIRHQLYDLKVENTTVGKIIDQAIKELYKIESRQLEKGE